MQGLANFAADVGGAITFLVPAFCYLAAIAAFLFGAWGFWQQAQPHNPFRGKPWIPWVSLVLSGVFASFDGILTMANRSGGSSIIVGTGGAFGYVPSASGALGATPAETVVNVVTIFQGFFQAFGAMMALMAVFAWWAVMRGISRRPQGGCLVQFVFGVMLINVLPLATFLAALFA
ncbi:Hypothetical protein RMHFA_05086 (plasmid) [Roseomonas mucosa]|jgi:hypothetical protein|uniref:Uncharacterized protein n=1 Tax=Roseomonas mucosa TaxID=207340 RepID=A0A379PNQ0_9PROT|nr:MULTISPECIES: hypothetical protein [Roseomonas]MCG7354885.1 hypothetical protein [Roseomonas mucosa]QDD97305.1 Hypothetical protein ADP8_05086a [Roseomonas mucosa]QET91536.1 hypothetical protein FOB66_01030 [Roseomonas mucosa]UZO99382.1 Hypothetical protein RMHFA_05086 [Roseomonas mucosa]SUE95461.1 Uncharacterised protein [Roseomonas mucosa]